MQCTFRLTKHSQH